MMTKSDLLKVIKEHIEKSDLLDEEKEPLYLKTMAEINLFCYQFGNSLGKCFQLMD